MGRRVRPLLDNYASYLASERGLSQVTIDRRVRVIEQWLIWLGLRRKSPMTATREDAQTWWMEHREGHAPNTLATHLSDLRDWYRWLNSEAGIPAPRWFENYRVRRVGIRNPNWLSVPEMERLLEAARGNRPQDLRARALVALLWSTGSRIGALLEADVEHLVPHRGRIWLNRVKGGTERYEAILHPRAWQITQEYLELARPRLWSERAGHALLVGDRGQRWNRESARQTFAHLADKAGLKTRVRPHDIRRTAVTQLVENGADLRQAQAFLGHLVLRSTERYMQYLRNRELAKAEARHPMDLGVTGR